MPDSFLGRIRTAWNTIATADRSVYRFQELGYGTSFKPDRPKLRLNGLDRSVIAAIYNRISIDAMSIDIRHIRTDENNRYKETITGHLNDCFSLEANIDQTGRNLVQDIILSMFDEGCVAVVPTDTSGDIFKDETFEIYTMRVGHILEWFPAHVMVRLYNERTGKKEDIVVPKRTTAIIENPLYAVMNEPNSTLQRLIRKLILLDRIDEQTGSGKLDLIIQLPYVIKTKERRDQAEKRRQLIEDQLANSAYGIAYTDGTEKIVQLNRAVENTLLQQTQDLLAQLYNQLGLAETIFDGTADEQTMLNYYNRTIEPIMTAIVEECKRKFLTKTAITQHQSIMFFRDAFKLVPVAQMADIADKFTRNEILSPNEIRAIVGYKPVDDPKADELRNRNINQATEGDDPPSTEEDGDAEDDPGGETESEEDEEE